MASVLFYSIDIDLLLPKKLIVRRFIKKIFLLEKKLLKKVDFIFCTDEYLFLLNQKFLNHDYYTDILTFDNSVGTLIIGEIYISIDRVRDNASANFVSFYEEMLRIIIHGVLHLCGYNDKTIIEKDKMTEIENVYLEKFETFHVESK